MKGLTAFLLKHFIMPKIEATHLITLSEFVEQIKREESTFSAQNAIDIIAYNDFLNQPLRIEMFNSSSSDCIFSHFDVAGNSAKMKTGYCFNFFFKKETGIHSFMTLERLAEATKEEPLKFSTAPYYESIH